MEPTPAPDEAPTTKTPVLRGKRLPAAIVAGGAAFAMTLAGLGIAAAQTDDATTTAPPSSTDPADGDGERDGAGRHGPGHTHADHHPHARLTVAAAALDLSTADLKAELVAGKSIAQVAEAKGVDPKTVVDALVADATAVLNAAVDDGRLTREQADARIATLPERMQHVVDRTRTGEDGPRRKGPGKGHEQGHGHGHGHKADPQRIAELLGISAEQLKAGHEAGKSIATLATENGRDPQTVIDALVADAQAKLAQALTDGKLTQAQADERRTDLTQRITDFVNRTPQPHDNERRGPRHHKPNLDAAAGVLGMTIDELRTQLQSGKSLAAIAGEKDVPVGQVVSAIVADARARLAQAVTDGKLTQAQADERSADLERRITDLVNRTPRPRDGEVRPATLSA